MRTTVEKFEGFVLSKLPKQIMQTHVETELGSITVWYPRISCGERTDKWRNGKRRRQCSVTIVSAAGRNAGNCCVQKAGKEPGTGAAIIGGIFVKGFGQRILRRRCNQADTQVAGYSRAVGVSALAPLSRKVKSLIDGSGYRRTSEGHGADRVPCKIVELLRLARRNIGRGRTRRYAINRRSGRRNIRGEKIRRFAGYLASRGNLCPDTTCEHEKRSNDNCEFD